MAKHLAGRSTNVAFFTLESIFAFERLTGSGDNSKMWPKEQSFEQVWRDKLPGRVLVHPQPPAPKVWQLPIMRCNMFFFPVSD